MNKVYTQWVEIPVRVSVELQKAELATLSYPGCPEGTFLEDIEICRYDDDMSLAADLEDLKESIIDKLKDKFEEDA